MHSNPPSYTVHDAIAAVRNLIEDAQRNGCAGETMSTALIQSTGVRGDVLQSIRESLGDCTRCILSKGRKQIVFGVGNPDADLVVVGEAPGRDEDIQGEPFVGKAGQLLTDILQAIGLSRQDVYICNVVKCRPPENRNPEIEEIETCLPYLQKQIEAIAPKLILTVGKFAAQTLLQTDRPISKLRGCFVDYNGVPLMPTYHPAFLLRNPSAKKEVWEDVKQVHARLSELTGKTYSLKGAK